MICRGESIRFDRVLTISAGARDEPFTLELRREASILMNQVPRQRHRIGRLGKRRRNEIASVYQRPSISEKSDLDSLSGPYVVKRSGKCFSTTCSEHILMG